MLRIRNVNFPFLVGLSNIIFRELKGQTCKQGRHGTEIPEDIMMINFAVTDEEVGFYLFFFG